ncbi:hypothetical protein M405DRAFT_12683 [Rhizopogon salebrosus TDB-379]|nr:hypothetical protein M405DRAFT_12683 [Rhizopogon salebrosus TDB-379]
MWAGNELIKTNDKGICSPSARALRSIKASTLSLIQRLLSPTSPSDPATESAVRWLLATSTNPDNIAAAVALIPTITWSPDSDIASYCQQIRDTFVDCFEIDGRLRPSAEDRAVACGRALNHLVLAYIPIGHESNTRTVSQLLKVWQEWRNIILPREFDHCKALACQLPTLSGYDKQRCRADTRTALRMMIAAAGDGFIHPDNESTVWRGRFTWGGDPRIAADFNWLIDYLRSCSKDHVLMGDALLALSATNVLGSSNDRTPAYLEALISAM